MAFRYINLTNSLLLFPLVVILCGIYPRVVFADSYTGEITFAVFSTAIKNNKPVDEVLILENSRSKLYFFSEVKNMSGQTLVHRWEHRGKTVYQEKFSITTKSQQLISSYKLDPSKTGEWMVVISNGSGWPMKAVMFKYVKKGSFAGKGILPVKK